MVESSPSSPPSKEHTSPLHGTPSLPGPEREKKPDKKLETPVLVAIISAAVTLITTILGSPLLLHMINNTSTPAATPAAELSISQNSLPPITPQGGAIFKATSNPTESGRGSLELRPAAPGENPTSAPTAQKPAPPTAAAGASFQCIAADLWSPYPSTLHPETRDGCWDLADWGFSSDQGRLNLAQTPGQDQERGMYMPISGDVEIRFNLRLNKIRTRSNKTGFLNFGVVQNDPLSIYKGGYLSYQQPTPGTAAPVRVLVSGSNQATQKIAELEAGFEHEIVLSIRDERLTVYLNGEPAGDPVRLTPGERAFWIGYVLPSKSELDAVISNFSMGAVGK